MKDARHEQKRRGTPAVPNPAALLVSHSETERARIARIVHDGLAQKLTVAGMELSLWKSELQPGRTVRAEDVESKIAALNQLISESIASAREVSAALYPRILESFGIGAAVETIVGRAAKRSKATARFSQDDEKLTIDPSLGIHLVRATESILAEATLPEGAVLDAKLLTAGTTLYLRLTAKGATFTVPAEPRARIEAFGGSIQAGQGSLTISLPTSAI